MFGWKGEQTFDDVVVDFDVSTLVPNYLSAGSRSSSDKSVTSPRSDEPLVSPMKASLSNYHVFLLPSHAQAGSDSENSEASSTLPMLPLHRKSSLPTPRSNNQSVPEAVGETLPLLHSRGVLMMKRPASVCVPSAHRRKRKIKRSLWSSTQMSAHFNHTARRWTRGYHELSGIDEFPSVSEAGDDAVETTEDESVDAVVDVQPASQPTTSSWHVGDMMLSPVRSVIRAFQFFVWDPLEFGTTFVRRLTIPLVDDETWNKGFAVICPPCAILFAGVSVLKLNPLTNLLFAASIVVAGGAGSVFVLITASRDSPPEGKWLAPYLCLAFVMSIVWIMNIADEVLAVLETLGSLFGISDSVLGVSVLAWGNSVGDLVSNTAIARDGFPTMAFAGCFAGPMFNLLVGLGLAVTIAIVSHGPISMDTPATLVYVGFAYLFTSLAVNLGCAARDGFRYGPRLCYGLLLLYTSFAVLSVVLVASEPSASTARPGNTAPIK
ncbi:hypothetical protein PINS_up001636 [Pythium insidiosum]|nr:hypothetical protein PINS_up001636 [Pythium insidiosum]